MAAVADVPAAGRVAMVAGATGLVGREVLAVLLADKRYRAVHSVGRRAAHAGHARLTQHTAEPGRLPRLPAIDDAYIALGTTIAAAGSRAAFRAVDLDAVVAIAQAARQAGASRLAVVSAMGANAASRIFYSRVKGEMEQALAGIGFATLVLARPSVLAGDRAALGQAQRPGERAALALTRVLGPLVPANYRAIGAADVARAMVEAVLAGKPGTQVLLSGPMQG